MRHSPRPHRAPAARRRTHTLAITLTLAACAPDDAATDTAPAAAPPAECACPVVEVVIFTPTAPTVPAIPYTGEVVSLHTCRHTRGDEEPPVCEPIPWTDDGAALTPVGPLGDFYRLALLR